MIEFLQTPCTCPDPEFIKHGGWHYCKHCGGVLPYVPIAEVFEHMRIQIDEGRANLARRFRQPE